MKPSSRHFGRFLLAAALAAGLALPARAKNITLVWEANSEADLAGYKVYWGTASRSYGTPVAVPLANLSDPARPAFTVTGLSDGTAYFFAVTAYNQAGRESSFSNEVFAGLLTMFYPRLAAESAGPGSPQYTGVALANLDQAAALLSLKALDSSGSQPSGAGITNPVLVSLDPGTQLPFIDSQQFGEGLAVQSPLGWARIESTAAGVSGFFLMFDGERTVLDGGLTDVAPQTSSVLTEVDAAGFTKVNIINPHEEEVAATIELVGSAGGVSRTATRTIPAKGSLVADLAAEIFPGLSPSGSDYMRIRSTSSVIAAELAGQKGRYVQFLQGQNPAQGATSLYSPQYAIGDQWHSTITVVNLDAVSDTVSFRFVGEDGAQIGTPRTVPIAANGKIYVGERDFFGQLPAPGTSLSQGYVEISSNGARLAGSAVFGDPAKNSSAALPLVSALRNSLVFSHIASSDIWYTGLAVLNPNPQSASVTIDVYSADGVRLHSKTEVIAAGRRISGLLTQHFPALIGANRTSGYIRVRADRPVAAFALFGTTSQSVLSAIPAQPAP